MLACHSCPLEEPEEQTANDFSNYSIQLFSFSFPSGSDGFIRKPRLVQDQRRGKERSLADDVDAFRDPVHRARAKVLRREIAHAEAEEEREDIEYDRERLFHLDRDLRKAGIHEAETDDHERHENEGAGKDRRCRSNAHDLILLFTLQDERAENAEPRKQETERLHREEHLIETLKGTDVQRVEQLIKRLQEPRENDVDRARRKQRVSALRHLIVEISLQNDRDEIHKSHAD